MDRVAATDAALLLTGDPWQATRVVERLAEARPEAAGPAGPMAVEELLAAVVARCRAEGRRARRGTLRVVADPGCDRSRAAREALVALPFRLRVVVVLHHCHGLGVEEVAAVLGRRSATVVRRRDRALRRLGADVVRQLARGARPA